MENYPYHKTKDIGKTYKFGDVFIRSNWFTDLKVLAIIMIFNRKNQILDLGC